MIFRLKIRTDSVAFHDEATAEYDPAFELARLLRETADRVERGEYIGQYLTIFDENGNDVGRFALKGE